MYQIDSCICTVAAGHISVMNHCQLLWTNSRARYYIHVVWYFMQGLKKEKEIRQIMHQFVPYLTQVDECIYSSK